MTLRWNGWLGVALCLFGAWLAPVDTIRAGELRIAAAADLQFVFDGLVRQFQAAHPETQVSISYGSSGNFYAQLQQQAPFDLFFSADTAYPKRLADAGLASATNLFLYAMGHIVVWVPAKSSIDLAKPGLNALLDPAIRKIAIANPDHAPYGRAALAALKSLKLYDRVRPKLVYGEHVAQAAEFVQTGAADAGIIALSVALSPTMKASGRFLEVPPDAYPRIEQAGVMLKWAKDPAAARAFRDFVSSDSARAALRQAGFAVPEQ
jgi:molybdate transport system substrate-binding protein